MTARSVVSKDAKKTRQVKSSSYDLTDQYEVDLLNYAEDPAHGNYSEFVKRLIAEHKYKAENPQAATATARTFTEKKEVKTDSMSSFL